MNFSRTLLATHKSVGAPSGPLRSAVDTLLPPIPLYRRLFRAHRHKLSPEMRLLGDAYIKSEFRSHQNVENPIHIVGFLTQWQLYAQQIEGETWRDNKLEKEQIDKMSDQQLGQLYELMQSIKKDDSDSGNDDSTP